jgi:hypothetical protein
MKRLSGPKIADMLDKLVLIMERCTIIGHVFLDYGSYPMSMS